MLDISLPQSIRFERQSDMEATVTIEPCFPGYGLTLGNAMRRILLSSLPGAAVTELKIRGVQHEFSTAAHVKEDVVEILTNIKQLRPKLLDTEKTTLKLSLKGKHTVKASDFQINSQVEIMNPDLVIATMTDEAASLNLDLTIEAGLGYLPVETREKREKEIGRIQVDAVFSPVRNVSFKTEHVRVGGVTNYDKIVLGITTDGSISPEDAFRKSAQILVDQFQRLTQSSDDAETEKSQLSVAS
ncbi:MAG: DNA-directed RNA polymerase subunit alpha [Candidatus Kerfeldbacteria bacterium]|nr:DNA-directed RNA polymerase subunit alpha [Candidatus Kerfeldbacteria bacterium]